MKENRYLTVDNYMLDKGLDMIKKTTGIGEVDNTKILIDTDDNALKKMIVKYDYSWRLILTILRKSIAS